MIDEFVKEYFSLLDKMRNGYKESLGIASQMMAFKKTSVELFFKTVIAFYLKNIFDLNRDGFLDYDFEKESIIGAEYNPGIDYWTQ